VSGRKTGAPLLRAAWWAGRTLRDAVRGVVEFAAPDACGVCGAPTGAPPPLQGLSAPVRCLATPATVSVIGGFTVINHPFCRRCLSRFEARRGRSILGTVGASDSAVWVRARRGELFSQARTGKRRIAPFALEAIAPFSMNDAALGLVHLIKFAGRTSLAAPAAAAMAEALGGSEVTGERPVFVPVPMHPAARRRRGFNQAELLGRALTRLTGTPLADDAIVKRRRTRPQSLTDHGGRAGNVRGAFEPGGFPLAGRSVYLVDDLVTTGATAAACAAAALAAGAVDVSIVCLAAFP
jgi:ComF family protein